jgi:hypothetical protein
MINIKVKRYEAKHRFSGHSTSTLAADHVNEAQPLANFVKLLTAEDGDIGTTYTKPTAVRVLERVLGGGPLLIISLGDKDAGSLYTPKKGDTPVAIMAYGFGRSNGVESTSGGQTVERVPRERGNKNLVLLDDYINGSKGIWFGKNKLNSDWKGHLS